MLVKSSAFSSQVFENRNGLKTSNGGEVQLNNKQPAIGDRSRCKVCGQEIAYIKLTHAIGSDWVHTVYLPNIDHAASPIEDAPTAPTPAALIAEVRTGLMETVGGDSSQAEALAALDQLEAMLCLD